MTPTLDGFCKHIAAQRVLNRADTAWAFNKYFDLSYSLTLDELRELLRQAGVESTSDIPLPKSFGGFNCSLDGVSPIIIYRENDRTDVQKHTLLHEIYEIIQDIRGYPQVGPVQDETEADRFAELVLLSMSLFDYMAQSSGRVSLRWRLAGLLFGGRKAGISGTMSWTHPLPEPCPLKRV